MPVAAILQPPPSPEEMRQAFGGELGATLFVAGLRIWIPEAATRADVEGAVRGLQCFAEVLPISGKCTE